MNDLARRSVCIITTVQHNVGDDFVRDGIIHLLGQVLGPTELQLIHKHLPITARPGFNWVHSSGLANRLDKVSANFTLRTTRRLDAVLPLRRTSDRVRTADILVQSGGPVYWANEEGDCADTEWWHPLIERRWIPYAKGRPFLNLAGGTCQAYHSDASEFTRHPKVLEHIRRFYDLTALTTVRDELSVEVLRQAGRDAHLLPCTSLFAVDQQAITPSPGEYIVLNYMPTGGHFVLGEPTDAAAWETRFVALARRLAKGQRVIMVCHNQKEKEAARCLLPELESFYSEDYREYLRLYSKAHWGILNRVHGCFALASLGKPSAVIGSDSRARMAKQLGLPVVFVNDATDDWLESTAEHLATLVDTFPDYMAALKADAAKKYGALLYPALGLSRVKAAS